MRRYRFLQLDVFTDRAFDGNPLAVFPEADDLTDEEMQQIAREMNLSETVFVLPPRDPQTLRRLRIFTPVRELPFAGHPVAGTWTALAREGVVPVPENGQGWSRITHEVGIGVLPVDVEFADGVPVRVVMTQGKFEARAEVTDASERELVAGGLGLALDDLDEAQPVQAISTGITVLTVPLRSLEALGRCRVEAAQLSEAYTSVGAIGCYPFTRETVDGGSSQAHARLFAPDDNIPEDPATGSAAGALGAYLVHHGALAIEPEDGLFHFRVEQGDFIKRRSRISVEVKGTRGAVERVRVGGSAVVVANGELMF